MISKFCYDNYFPKKYKKDNKINNFKNKYFKYKTKYLSLKKNIK